MRIDKDKVIRNHYRSLLRPHQALNLLLAQHRPCFHDLQERSLLDCDDSIMLNISDMLILWVILDIGKKEGREFLKEDDISPKLKQTILNNHHLLSII